MSDFEVLDVELRPGAGDRTHRCLALAIPNSFPPFGAGLGFCGGYHIHEDE